MNIYLRNLSGLFPKIAGLSLAAVVILGIVLFALYGDLSLNQLLGADKVDESNFITYLILEK